MPLASVAWGISTGMMAPLAGRHRRVFGHGVLVWVQSWWHRRARGQMMGWLRIIGVLAMAVCVDGCARNWVRAGADGADLAREKFECQFEAAKAVAGAETEAENAEAKRGEFESLGRRCLWLYTNWIRTLGRSDSSRRRCRSRPAPSGCRG
jgi:hypothetical protein